MKDAILGFTLLKFFKVTLYVKILDYIKLHLSWNHKNDKT